MRCILLLVIALQIGNWLDDGTSVTTQPLPPTLPTADEQKKEDENGKKPLAYPIPRDKQSVGRRRGGRSI